MSRILSRITNGEDSPEMSLKTDGSEGDVPKIHCRVAEWLYRCVGACLSCLGASELFDRQGYGRHEYRIGIIFPLTRTPASGFDAEAHSLLCIGVLLDLAEVSFVPYSSWHYPHVFRFTNCLRIDIVLPVFVRGARHQGVFCFFLSLEFIRYLHYVLHNLEAAGLQHGVWASLERVIMKNGVEHRNEFQSESSAFP